MSSDRPLQEHKAHAEADQACDQQGDLSRP
jgi:hypothetical protein